ncbi:MAG: DUF441 domain-containing protein [Firmicutes bacterium]|nr:DUF441 domain-containing protein [Bacillota bacterium]
MLKANLVLFLFLCLGLFFGNSLVAAGAGTLLVLKLLNSPVLLAVLERHALQWGLLFLLIAVMVPLAKDQSGWRALIQVLFSPTGLAAVAGGITAAYLSGEGLGLLSFQPEIMVGLVIGTVLGVFFFKGMPVGPLAAAGLTAVLLKLMGLAQK